MGLLMVFRTNSAYDRWWEARKLWGQLVNEIRNFSIKLRTLLPTDEPRRKKIAHLLMQFPQVLRDHLRGKLRIKSIDRGSAEIVSLGHIPMQYAQAVYQNVIELKREGRIDGYELLQLDPHARSLMDICGACERILRSPIAGSYKLMIWTGIFSYLGALPWMLVPIVDVWSLGLVAASAYFVLGIELLAEDIERPFGTSPNDLPLDAVCATIRESVQSALDVDASEALEQTGGGMGVQLFVPFKADES